MRGFGAALILSLGAAAAQAAEPVDYEGAYVSPPGAQNHVVMRLVLMDDEDGQSPLYGASFSAHNDATTHVGWVFASGRRRGDTLVLTAKGPPEGPCELTVKFSQSHRRADVAEDNCVFFHGVGTQFEGRLRRAGP